MQTILWARFETAASDAALATRRAARAIGLVRRETKSEVAYFTCEKGSPAGVTFFEMMESSLMPAPFDLSSVARAAERPIAPALVVDEPAVRLAPV
jgi:hypothetical protein